MTITNIPAIRAIENLLSDGNWWTVERIRTALKDQHGIESHPTVIKANIRNLRKADQGGRKIACSETQSKSGGPIGVPTYRMEVRA